MIQRVQTIYMLASVIAILTMNFFWLASFSVAEGTFELTSLGLTSLNPEIACDRMDWLLFGLLLVMLLLPLVNIFLYNKRKIQLRVLIYTIVLDLIYYGVFFWCCSNHKELVASMSEAGSEVLVNYNYMMLAMPALSVFCLIMAARGVIFDIALLKGLDRLR